MRSKERSERILKETWIERFKSTHGEKYSYDLNQIFKSTSKIEIICPSHGLFLQSCKEHWKYGCSKCALEKRNKKRKFSYDDILSRLKNSRENNTYEYFLHDNPKIKDDVLISCFSHGEFRQKIESHLLGQGCPKCYLDNKKFKGSQHKESDEWIKIFNSVHGNKYSYSFPDELYNSSSKIGAKCNTCNNSFYIIPYAHAQNKYKCKTCFPGNVSSYENIISNFIDSLGISHICSYKPEFLNGKEIDIFIPEYNLGIEFNGSYWHSDKFIDKYYHFEKWKKCKENNIILLNIWEHYWNYENRSKIYLYKIIHYINLDNKIFARKCSLSSISKEDYNLFIKNNHLEGEVFPYLDMKYIGLYYNNILVMVAGYGKFWIQSSKVFIWKLQRICTLLGLTVIGGISKISKYIKNDIGDFQFQVTLDTGGTLIKRDIEKKDISLRYWWVKNNIFLSRNKTQVSFLKEKSDWQNGDTERSYMERNNFRKIFDTGVFEIEN